MVVIKKAVAGTLLCIALGLALVRPAQAQFTANLQTNIISSVTSNWVSALGYFVGSNTFKDLLLIRNGGVLTNGNGLIGYVVGATNNAVVVSGSGSVWNNRTNLAVGVFSSGNSLVISNQGKVVTGDGFVLNGIGFIGDQASSSNNSVLVTDSGSVWSNQSFTIVGYFASGNSLVISNQGRVVDDQGEIGGNAGSSNNSALVIGAGSVWVNRQNLTVGGAGSSNLLTVAGGSVIASSLSIGAGDFSTNNTLQVNSGSLFVTNATGSGVLTVSPTLLAFIGKGSLILNGGSVTADSLMVINGTNSIISINGGTLSATTVSIDNDQDLVIGGAFLFSNATISVNQLVLTNGASSVMPFPKGLIQATGTTVSNGQQFVIGSGTNGANYQLLGGVHSFNNGLRIRDAATLTGCGTVNGSVTIDSNGSVFADCGTLTFTGTVTNNYALAVDGDTSVLEFYGTVVNNGGILLYNGGTTNFHGTFINNGIVLNAGWVHVSSVTRVGNDEMISAPSTNGFRYQLQITTSVVSPVWTNSGTAQAGTGSILTFTDPGGATNKPTRFYQVDAIWP